MINYSLRQIYSFEATIRLQSFTKASRVLNLTQPAVYMQVKQLQNHLGVILFQTQGKSIQPTEMGKQFYQTCQKIITILEQSKKHIDQTLNPETGKITIAVVTTANSFVSRLLSEFKKIHPQISFHLNVNNRQYLLEKLINQQVDLAIMGNPPADNPFITEKFMDNPLIAIAHPEHPLTQKKQITIEALKKESLITRELGSGTRMAIEKHSGLNFDADIQINSNEAIVEAVQAGLGIGFVSKHTVNLELHHQIITQLSVVDFPIMRHWYMVYHEKQQLSPITKKFKAFIFQYIQNVEN